MDIEIINLTSDQCEDLESRLEEYDSKQIKYKLSGNIDLGIKVDGKLIAGASGSMTAFKIFYLSTLFVDEEHRYKGFGKKLMECVEKSAKELGANMIRLDTFGWQGSEFYKKLGYEVVGEYKNEIDNFSEYFFVKRI